MSGTALILAAHGSRLNPLVNEHIERLAARLRVRSEFDEVATAFHQGAPLFRSVLDTLSATQATVVPLMTSAGYYADVVLPRELRRNRRFGQMRVTITPPVGTHEGIAALVIARVRRLFAAYGIAPARAVVAVIGHGTKRHRHSRDSTESLAAALAKRCVAGAVLTAYLDDDPLIESILERTDGRHVFVLPFLVGAGPHAQDDLPCRIGLQVAEGASLPLANRLNGRLVVCDVPIGCDPRFEDLVINLTRMPVIATAPLEIRTHKVISATAIRSIRSSLRNRRSLCGHRCHGAPSVLRRRALRLGTRSSPLAFWQANHVAGQLRNRGVAVELFRMTTSGDRDLNRPIDELASDSPFTDDIDEALRGGEIDLAVHCLKDLPLGAALLAAGGELPGEKDICGTANDEKEPGPDCPGSEVTASRLAIRNTEFMVLPRGDARETLVSLRRLRLAELPAGARVGTSSPRRRAQILAVRPDLIPVPIRGSVDQRVRQVRSGAFDAAILAAAGLERLGLLDEVAEVFPIERFVPAAGQGALVLQVRSGDRRSKEAVRFLDDPATRRATAAELATAGAMPQTDAFTFAAHAEAAEWISLRARFTSCDGAWSYDAHVTGLDPPAVAREAVERLRGQAPLEVGR